MYIDLNLEVRTNAEFRYKVTQLTQEIQQLEKANDGNPHADDRISERILDIYRLCKYNAGLLVPYFFPRYPNNQPLSCSARPYSYAMFHMQIGGFTVFRSSRQIGKCLGHATNITAKIKNASEVNISASALFDIACKAADG